MERATVTPEQVVAELSELLERDDTDPSSVVMSFDGDGTLWTGDIGEDLFNRALDEQFLLEEATPALLREAERFNLDLAGAEGANAIAQQLMQAYLAGQYPERDTCAMMTWCFAGRMLAEVDELARRVVSQDDVAGRIQQEVLPILELARAKRIRSVLISASPRAIVEASGALLGFGPKDVAAATPKVVGGRVAPEMDGPVPYAEDKLTTGRQLFGQTRWLAAFGDNVFDIDMLTTAELGVAVRPKPRLRDKLSGLRIKVLVAPEHASERATHR